MEFLLFIVILTIVVGACWLVADVADELAAQRRARNPSAHGRRIRS
ncbi:hypothetical protein AB3X52_18185 [Nocardioides sp. DS6]|uniref:Uncharacterized protein n=1 Tax=Nocardioides eburneus TaxID=3231482 RepID=A0ABV3T5M7_9ACTN